MQLVMLSGRAMFCGTRRVKRAAMPPSLVVVAIMGPCKSSLPVPGCTPEVPCDASR